MASKPTGSSSTPKKSLEELIERGYGNVISKIKQLKGEIDADRIVHIKEKLDKNAKNLECHMNKMLSERSTADYSSAENISTAVHRLAVESAQSVLHGFLPVSGSADREFDMHEPICFNSSKMTKFERIPTYTTWIFLNRNQRMTEEQSVVGRRRIYYDASGNEALVCTDSDDDILEVDENKYDFSAGEDRILWLAFQEHGLNEDTVDVVSHFIGGTPVAMQNRCNELKLKFESTQEHGSTQGNIPLEESLSVALDSFDTLFCRRCLVFDCRLHGCSQTLIYPSDKKLSWSEPEGKEPCSYQCHLLGIQTTEKLAADLDSTSVLQMEHDILEGENRRSNVYSSDKNVDDATIVSLSSPAQERDEVRDANRSLDSNQPAISYGVQMEKLTGICGWKPLEEDLYEKGIEIFGKNSCLIARNLLSGLKTCAEVFHYMHNNGSAMHHKLDTAFSSEVSRRADLDNVKRELSLRPKSRICRKRGRTRKLKYSSKSSGHPSSWRRVGDGNQALKHYTPCSCENMCGKDCSCLSNGTCCEKFCGCSKSCKNKFRGCHCVKSQCRSRQCPCFAANRECDPDVCRNCWVSCGGGALGEPPKRGDGQCGNMRILLRQPQSVLLGRSDISGWGAFIKKTVNKHEFLGEYTGELISHREADKRGKIYDRVNSSFLFDLDDQYVLDACRQGDKLKFANHSLKPNCYCKVLMVGGDHRVAIFAKERIEATEELFYDYCYGPNEAPPWAQRPETSKKDSLVPFSGRARKHQSQ